MADQKDPKDDNKDEMVVVNEELEALNAVKADSATFMLKTVELRQAVFENHRVKGVVKVLNELGLSQLEPKTANDVVLSYMVKNGDISKETYDKFWELVEPYNKQYFDSYKPYRDIRNEAFAGLEKVQTFSEISSIEEKFMSKIITVMNDEHVVIEKFIETCNNACPYCSQTLMKSELVGTLKPKPNTTDSDEPKPSTTDSDEPKPSTTDSDLKNE